MYTKKEVHLIEHIETNTLTLKKMTKLTDF